MECYMNGELTLVEHGAGGGALIVLTACTATGIRLSPCAKVDMVAFLANTAIFPLDGGDIFIATILIRELLIKPDGVYAHKSFSFFHATKVASNLN